MKRMSLCIALTLGALAALAPNALAGKWTANMKEGKPAFQSMGPLAFGPEGGWTEDELKSFREAGWVSASLGNTILRAETAAIAAMAIAISANV